MKDSQLCMYVCMYCTRAYACMYSIVMLIWKFSAGAVAMTKEYLEFLRTKRLHHHAIYAGAEKHSRHRRSWGEQLQHLQIVDHQV